VAVEITCATRAGGERNEDLVLAGSDFAVVLDGATPEPGVRHGCRHGVSWVVRGLGRGLATGLIERPDADLRMLLRNAITEVMAAHGSDCDLTNKRSPAATVGILRRRDDTVEHLVLGDVAAAVQLADGEVRVSTDRRIDGFPELSWADLRHLRNRAGGFWVASNSPDAAEHAYVGSWAADRVHRVCLATDGGYRLVDRYGWDWPKLLDCLADEGLQSVVTRTRAAEAVTPDGAYPGKRHDDASLVLCVVNPTPPVGSVPADPRHPEVIPCLS
jgi:hypothetical protein